MSYAYMTVVISKEPLSLEKDQPALFLKTQKGEVVVSPILEITAHNYEFVFFKMVKILRNLVDAARKGRSK